MAAVRDVEVVVFDVLGTLVDEPSGLRAGIREAVPASGEEQVGELLALWQRYGERQQRRIGQGSRVYANTSVIDAEAAQLVAARAGFTDPRAVARLATQGSGCLPGAIPWPVSSNCPGTSPYSGSPTPRTPLCYGSTPMPDSAGTRPCPPKPSRPTSRPRGCTNSPSTPPDARRTACSWWPPTPGTCAEPGRRGCGPPTSTGPSGTRPRAVTPSIGDSTG